MGVKGRVEGPNKVLIEERADNVFAEHTSAPVTLPVLASVKVTVTAVS
jgi:hypothetical protein